MPPHIKGFPFEKRLSLNTFLEGCIGGQNRRVDFPFVEQQVQEFQFGIIEGLSEHEIQINLEVT